MPMMDLTLPLGVLDPDGRTALIDELTTVLLRAERAPDIELFRAVTWAFVHELPPGDVYSAGRPVDRPIVRLEVTTPEGALSQRRRAEIVAEATRVICGALRIGEQDALRVWVICREVPEGSWGAAGQVVAFRKLQEMAAVATSETAGA